jgi:cell division protein FtsN
MAVRRGQVGWGRRLGLFAAAALVVSLTFALGVLVGRQWARPSLPSQAGTGGEDVLRAPAGPEPGVAPASGRSSEASASRDQERPEKEKLTFYQTLTAPVGPVGPAPGGAERKSTAPSRAQATPAAGAITPAPAAISRPVDDGRPGGRWAVQVGAFKSREQAEGVQRRLADSGYAVSITPVAASDGLRYRVRLGGYGTRGEAEQAAMRVRTSSGLSTFVTPL